MIKQTRTFVKLELSDEAYLEILSKLRAAGYYHAFQEDQDNPKNVIIDMHGIAVCKEHKNKP